MPKVVSNTTPILSLLKIGKLDILKALYETILIPQAVYQEIETGKNREFYTDVGKLDWIAIERITSRHERMYLFDLDDGEAETLILAQEQNADLVIIDEKCGRRYARQLGMATTGTIGVLLKAKKQGLIAEIAPLLQDLLDKQTWLGAELVKKALELAEEQ
jgi:predicted nucleic acid-binding protein